VLRLALQSEAMMFVPQQANLFQQLDTNGDGMLSREEFARAMASQPALQPQYGGVARSMSFQPQVAQPVPTMGMLQPQSMTHPQQILVQQPLLQMPAFGLAPPAQAVPNGSATTSHFHYYFQLLKSHFAHPGQTKMATRSLNGQLFPLIVEAFKSFDKDKDNILNPTEASDFFSHFVSEKLGFHGAMMTVAAWKSKDTAKGQQQLKSYTENKRTMDAQAFRVLTSDEDGYLQIHEVVDALSVGTTRHNMLLSAFGLDADEDDESFYYADHYA
jgi:Ca2+-binding EF-hand superfamily protein